jgi:hypothetical protein
MEAEHCECCVMQRKRIAELEAEVAGLLSRNLDLLDELDQDRDLPPSP